MIKIQVEVEIFDDPIYCEDSERKCDRLLSGEDGMVDECAAFVDDKRAMERLVRFDGLFKKCDQCKAAYQKVKNAKHLCFYDPYGCGHHDNCLLDENNGFECSHAEDHNITSKKRCEYWREEE